MGLVVTQAELNAAEDFINKKGLNVKPEWFISFCKKKQMKFREAKEELERRENDNCGDKESDQ